MITIQGVDPNMIANNIESAYPTHPGSILKDEIKRWLCYSKQS